MNIQQLEARVKKIESRNSQAEAAKAWETSLVRKILVALLTYVVISLFLIFVVGLRNPRIDALAQQLYRHWDFYSLP